VEKKLTLDVPFKVGKVFQGWKRIELFSISRVAYPEAGTTVTESSVPERKI